MKAKIVRIGNSQGLRIPKLLLEQTGMEGEVEIRVKDRSLVISPLCDRRVDWEPAFEAMAAAGDDRLLDELPIATEWDEAEWEWK
jgi:antitoxin MazE